MQHGIYLMQTAKDSKKEQNRKTDPLFITDRASGGVYYGGDQGWYSSNTRAFAGCGSVAGLNMLRILAHKYPEVFDDKKISPDLRRLKDETLYKDEFVYLMSGIYRKMLVAEVPLIRKIYDGTTRTNKVFKVIPSSLGLSLSGFITGMLRYCRNQGLFLHVKAMPTAFSSYDRGLDFIREGLKNSGSVVILTSLNRHPLKMYNGNSGELKNGYDSRKGVRSHFMTITGIVEGKDGEPPLIKLTTWGRVATVPYDRLNRSWQNMRAFTSCLFYFTPVDSKSVVIKDMAGAYIVYAKALFRGLFGWMLKD